MENDIKVFILVGLIKQPYKIELGTIQLVES